MGWDFLGSNGAVLYHRDYLIQRNLFRYVVRPGLQVGYCATAYDPGAHTIQQ